MKLFPAIDLLDGRSVRLFKGDFNQVTDYGNPIEMAKLWVKQGAQFLHLVDLNGAKMGQRENAAIIRAITDAVGVPVQLGGGIRSIKDAAYCLSELGVSRVILGTVCCEQPALIPAMIDRFGAEKIVCGIDVKDGKVAVRGWTEQSRIDPIELGLHMQSLGAQTIVYTDITRDGAMTGVNREACEKMMLETGLDVIASGGVNGLDDLIALEKMNLYGAILGKAIYEKVFTVTDALAVLEDNRLA